MLSNKFQQHEDNRIFLQECVCFYPYYMHFFIETANKGIIK